MNVNWGQHTWEEIRDYAREGALAVAAFGSTEQHGPMLPLDTDIHIAERVAVSGAKRAWDSFEIPALVLPVMPVGLASHHMRFAGTLTFQPETYITVVSEVLAGCRERMRQRRWGGFGALRLTAEARTTAAGHGDPALQ